MATIQGVYIALFGRPADPAGLAFFNGVTNNGANLASIGNLSGQPEYTTRFTGQSNVQIVNSIYQSLFGRDAEAAGLEFFTAALAAGRLNINNVAINILDGAQGDDKLVITNKLAAAATFTAALDTGTERAAYVGTAAADQGRAFLAPITKDVATIPTAAATDASIAKLVTASTGGVSLTVVNADLVSPTATDTKLKATNGDDTITVTDLYTGATKLDAGFGSDTLVIKSLDAAVTPAAGVITSVEKLFVTTTAANSALGVANISGLTQVWNDSSTKNLSVTDLALTTTVGLKGALGATTTGFAFANAAGSSDTATLALDTVTSTGATTIAAIETLNVSVTGTSSAVLTIADTTTLKVGGAGAATLTLTAAKLETLDASGNTGGITTDVSGSQALKSVIGSTAADTITIDTAGNLANVTVNGGAGADTLIVTPSAAVAFSVTLTGGVGPDTFRVGDFINVKTATSADFAKSIITISDFDKSSDTIDIKGIGARDTLTNTELANISSSATLFDAVTKAASFTDATKFSVFTFGSDTYIFNNDAGATFDANDGLVKITGVSNIADLTATNFLVA